MQSVVILWLMEVVMGFIAVDFHELSLVIRNFEWRPFNYESLYKVLTICTRSAQLRLLGAGSNNILPIDFCS